MANAPTDSLPHVAFGCEDLNMRYDMDKDEFVFEGRVSRSKLYHMLEEAETARELDDSIETGELE